MSEPNSSQILKSIARFRRLAIGSAALVAILSAAMIFRITSALDSTTASKMNIAGKQRLLAQRTLTDALTINNAARIADWDALEPALNDLTDTVQEFRNAHTDLHNGNDAFNAPSTAPEIQALQECDLPFLAMTNSAQELIKLTISMIRRSPYIDDQTFSRVTAAKDEIAVSFAQYMPKADSIIDIYEAEHQAAIAHSVNQAKVGMIILLLVLVSSVLFVVEPTILIIRRQLQRLDKATRHATRADSVRWRLLSNMSHEFRTPMTAIMGFADLLSQESLTEPERARLTKSIYDSSTHLTHLIETMLDMSAIESGQLRIVTEQCSLHTTLEKLRADTITLAQAKNIKLNLHIHESCPKQINTDTKRLEQIIYNLIDNAIKFTSSGQIDINARLVESDQSNTIEFKITDTGIGIKPQDLKSIFDPFTQSEDNVTRSFGGAGLGLAVSRDLANALGGDVTVESIPEKGSTFTLTITPAQVEPPRAFIKETDSTQSSLKSKRILIVDDAKDNRVLLKHILKKTGAQMEFALDGQQAVDTVTNAMNLDTPYDLILMDMQMPVLDGYHATVKLREMGITIPIIALTAHALDGDRQHCLDAGCNEYMTKPLNKPALIDTCIRLIAEHEPDLHQQRAA